MRAPYSERVTAFSATPQGPFDLAGQRRFFGGWLSPADDPEAIAMAFPLESWDGSALVVLRQGSDGTVSGEVSAPDGRADAAWRQAQAALSLDVDGSGFPAVGERDPVIGRLQQESGFLRPTLFHSPYEAACNFVIGQRISMAQARALRLRMADDAGDRVSGAGMEMAAFPRPQALLEMQEIRGLAAEKVSRLHGIARAALEGVLDRARLRALPIETALAEVSELRGVGPFSAQGIVHRGAGVVDELTDEPVSRQAVQRLYGLDHLPDPDELLRIAEPWRPYRMWATVLLHAWLRREGGGVARQRR